MSKPAKPATRTSRVTKAKPTKTKLLPHKHSGTIMPHHHTSYGSLALLLLLTFVPLVVAGHSIAYAATDGGGGYGAYAVVAGDAPKTAPTISGLANGATFRTAAPISVDGSCPANTMVRVYKNEVLAGAALCQNGKYTMPIDLFIGSNTLIARALTASELQGPDSTPVTAQLLVPGQAGNAPGVQGAPSGQFYLTSQVAYRGVEINQPLSFTVTPTSGQPPYAVSVDWGDGGVDLVSRPTSGPFDVSHTYKEAGPYHGSYPVIVRGTDAVGAKSLVQLVGIVSGPAPAAGVISSAGQVYHSSTTMRTVWQIFGVTVAAVGLLWIGERRQIGRLLGHGAKAV